MKTFEECRRWLLVAAIVAYGIPTAALAASAATFSARETHQGLSIDGADGTTGTLVGNGSFRRHGPALIYREGGDVVAGVWKTGPSAAVVRGGTTENAPVIGRIVPSWNNNALTLAIEPAGAATVRTSVFEHGSGGGTAALDRVTSTSEALQGTYRATLQSAGGGDAGWLSVEVDPEGGTRFSGDLPPTIPRALAAAAAVAVESEVDFIYEDVIDVRPIRR